MQHVGWLMSRALKEYMMAGCGTATQRSVEDKEIVPVWLCNLLLVSSQLQMQSPYVDALWTNGKYTIALRVGARLSAHACAVIC